MITLEVRSDFIVVKLEVSDATCAERERILLVK